MSIRILCTGDLHLGRQPARIPQMADRHVLRPTSAWQSFVDAAVERKVDAVVLTGDIVDESNKFYEAFSALRSGVQRLVAEDIVVLAVCGNHDFDVLPRLADQIPEFRLLGRGGRWQEYVLERDGVAAIQFQGWSFPTRHVSHNPLATYSDPPDSIPTVGIIHCDCDVPGSIYSPVSLIEMKAKTPIVWLLGHVHKAILLSKEYPLVLYPGSLQGLDPGEPGMHSAALLTVEPGSCPKVERLPLAGLRWEHVEVSIDSVEDEDSLLRRLISALIELHQGVRGELGQTRLIGCRIRLLGRTSLHRYLPSLIPTIQSDLQPTFDGIEYFVEDIENLSRPDISLEDIAKSTDPAGLLARRLLILESQDPSEEYQELIDRGRRSIEDARNRAHFAMLPDSATPLEQEQVRVLLQQAGLRALDELLAQKEAGK